jgi:phosphonate transport system ATP-binding protein
LHQPELALRFADRVIGIRAGAITFDADSAVVSPTMISSLYTTDAA